MQYVNVDDLPPLSPDQRTELQAIIGTLLHYARAVDPTLLTITNELASQQASPTVRVFKATNRALSYTAGNSNHCTIFHSCDMILHGHVDAFYLSCSYARSVAGAYLFLGDHHQPLKINGAIHTFSTSLVKITTEFIIIIRWWSPTIKVSHLEIISRIYMTSDTEDSTVTNDHHQPLKTNGAIHTFSTIIPCIGAQHATRLRTILADLGHPQPPTILMCDNTYMCDRYRHRLHYE